LLLFFQFGLRGGASAASAWGALVSFVCRRPHAATRSKGAANPLHRAGINAKTLGNPTYAFTSALTVIQGGRLSLNFYRFTLTLAD
jgi:hypothetical protein